jgi:hypothetical protein
LNHRRLVTHWPLSGPYSLGITARSKSDCRLGSGRELAQRSGTLGYVTNTTSNVC